VQVTVQKSGQIINQLSLERGSALIGSDPSVAINLPLASVLKRQAMLVQDAKGRWYLEDLGSAGRTLLNGKPTRRGRLHSGDRIDIGPFRLLIRHGKSDSKTLMDKAPAKLAELPETAVVRYPEDAISLRAVMVRNIQHITSRLLLISDQRQMLKEIIDCLLSIFEAVDAWIGLRTDMRAPIAISSGRSSSGKTIDDRSLPPAMIERALSHDHAVLVPRMSDFAGRGTRIQNFRRIGSAMSCPIQTARGTIGVVYIDNSAEGPAYTQVDLDQLIWVAANIGVAINRMVAEWSAKQQQPDPLVGSAAQIAALLKPAALPALANCTIQAAAYPGRGDGTDCHDVQVINEKILTVLVANTARHDGQALACLAQLRGAFTMWSTSERSPVELLKIMNKQCRTGPDPCQVHAMVVRLGLDSGQLELANAGSQPAFVINKSGKLSVLAAQDLIPLGLDALTEFTGRSIYMEPGQSLILWTKGLITARNAQRQQYGLERFTQSVEENFARPAADMLRDLWQDLRDFMKQNPQRNPITLMVIQPSLADTSS